MSSDVEISLVHLWINIWIGTWGRWNKWGMRGEMRWVHLRISTRVRVLGRLGCTGAFTRRTEQHARGPVKKIVVRYLQVETGLQIKNLARLCRPTASYASLCMTKDVLHQQFSTWRGGAREPRLGLAYFKGCCRSAKPDCALCLFKAELTTRLNNR